MISKKKLLKKSKLYVILDRDLWDDRKLSGVFKKIKDQKIDIIQLRDKASPKIKVLKLALRLKQLLNKKNIIFIINDYPDIAKIVNAEGLHIGQADLDIKEARNIVGYNRIIGVSCHNLKDLIAAYKMGADYLAIGPIFPTSLKPVEKPLGLDILNKINKMSLPVPVFAVGGINENNLNLVLRTGIKRIAVSSAICKAKDILKALKKINSKLR